MPRAADAYATADKHSWILAAAGHGEGWARVLRTGPRDRERIWTAIAAAVLHAPVSVVRDRGAHGVICGVTLTINDRTASVATAWRYVDADAAPRPVTAYPSAYMRPMAVVREITAFDRVELLEAPAGVLELRDRDTAMVEITTSDPSISGSTCGMLAN